MLYALHCVWDGIVENTTDQAKPIHTFLVEDIAVQIDGGFIGM